MGWRPIRVAVGSLGLALALGAWSIAGDSTPAASVPPPTVIRGEVADGAAPLSAGMTWQVQHSAPGRYVVTASGVVEVTTWDEVADVRIVPLADDGTEIRFRAGVLPVDTGFAFTVTLP